jgi:hypothetical protein
LKELNFIKVFLQAEEAIEAYNLGPSEISLLIAGFIGTWNRRRRPKEFQVPEVTLRSRSGQSSPSFKRSRQKLETLDLIRRIPGVRNEASPTYSLGAWFNMDHEESQETNREADDDPNREANSLNKERGKKKPVSSAEGEPDGFEAFWAQLRIVWILLQCFEDVVHVRCDRTRVFLPDVGALRAVGDTGCEAGC